jgi:CheY-like chemotaxis protein
MHTYGLDIVGLAGQLPSKPGSADCSVNEASGSQKARPRLLIVDDEKLIADTAREILEQEGFQAVAAYDGWSGIEVATKFRPDYLLTDVLMPLMNGVQLAIAVKKMLPAAKILLFSGQAGISDILLEGQTQGYEFELAPKPIHPEILIERLRSLGKK